MPGPDPHESTCHVGKRRHDNCGTCKEIKTSEGGAAVVAGRKARIGRITTDIRGLDVILGGGFPDRSWLRSNAGRRHFCTQHTMVQGGTGTGKSTLAMNFLAEGARKGEPGLMFTLEETREQIIETGSSRGWPLAQWDKQDLLRIVYTSPVELAGDALLQQAKDLVEQLGAKRVVIDSIAALGLSLAIEGRSTELIYALVKTFRAKGATTVATNEVPELMGTATISGEGYSYFVDNIILLRYVELESHLELAITVLKMRGSGHERVLRELKITGDSIAVLEPFLNLRGVLSGIPIPEGSNPESRKEGGASPRRSETKK